MSGPEIKSEHFSDPKVIALQTALLNRDPFYSGMCTVPDYQRHLYYTHDDQLRRIDFSNAGPQDLEALYHACKPAKFCRKEESAIEDSYGKAGMMDLVSLSTLFEPCSLGVHEQVSNALLTQIYGTMDVELYTLNVYGKGDFFKFKKDTTGSMDVFGSLVVVLPTQYEGGQFVLRHGAKEWTLDFTSKFATATEPSACFVAFLSNTEHEVLPITSGYHVTLTYNLYHKPTYPTTSSIRTPLHLKLKKALIDIVNDKSKLPNGGYLGFGLAHEYVHTGRNLLEPLLGQLKGSDRALADACDELGLRYSLRLLYRGIIDPRLNLITTNEFDIDCTRSQTFESSSEDHLRNVLEGLTIQQAEGIAFIGGQHKFDSRLLDNPYYHPWLGSFYRNPVTEVLEITPMKSSVDVKTSYMAYGNEAEWGYFYGTACMLIAVDSGDSRNLVEL